MAEPTTPDPKLKEQQPLPIPPIPQKQVLPEDEQPEKAVQDPEDLKTTNSAPPAPNRDPVFSRKEEDSDLEKAMKEIFNLIYELRQRIQSAVWELAKKGAALVSSALTSSADDVKAGPEPANEDSLQQDNNAEKTRNSESESPPQVGSSEQDETLDKMDGEEAGTKKEAEESAYDELAKGSDGATRDEPDANADIQLSSVTMQSAASSLPDMTAISPEPDGSAKIAANYDAMAAMANGDPDATNAAAAEKGVDVEDAAKAATAAI